MQNKEILLASRPAGVPADANFQFVDTETPPLNEDEVLLRMMYISVDPYLRGRMREGKSYIAPFEVGRVIESAGVGEVVESRSTNFKVGDVVRGQLGWRLYNVVNAKQLMSVVPGVSPSASLGVLGVTGLTAYFGLLDIGKPKAGETLVVSGAAGAVGIITCQIGKIKGCRVIGIAGNDEKTAYLKNELGVDETINYKTDNVHEKLKEYCPKGVDVYFDNVGGEISDAVMPLINQGARIVLCGLISMYNAEKPDLGPRPQPYLLVNRALMQGFIITDYMPRFLEGGMQLAQWLMEGKLKHAETIVEGFENIPKAFIGLFSGDNLGKQLVKL